MTTRIINPFLEFSAPGGAVTLPDDLLVLTSATGVTDQSGQGNDATYQGDAAVSAGRFVFDGVGDYLQTPVDPQTDIGNGGSWSIAFLMNATAATNNARIIGNSLANRFYVAMTTTQLFWGLGNKFQNTGLTYSTGVETHAAFTFDGTSLKTYKDGVLVHTYGYSAAGGATTFDAADISVGDIPASSLPYNGKLDHIRVGARDWTASEVADLYTAAT